MKRNKKLLLGAVAAMGAVAIGTGAVSTFAWYQATASKSISGVAADNTTLATGATATTVGDLYVYVQIAAENPVALTTKDGYAAGIVNGNVVPGTDGANTLFEEATLTVVAKTTWVDSQEEGQPGYGVVEPNELSGDPSAEDLHRLANGKHHTVTISAPSGSRTRVAAWAADKTKTNRTHFTGIFGNNFENNNVTVTITIDNTKDTVAQALVLSANKVFYSVSGELTNMTLAEAQASKKNDGDVNSIKGALHSTVSAQID